MRTKTSRFLEAGIDVNQRRPDAGFSMRPLLGALLLAMCAIVLFSCSSRQPTRLTTFPPQAPRSGTSLVLGRIVAVSSIPDPELSEYRDCVFTSKVHVLRSAGGDDSEQDMIVAMWAFRNRRLEPPASLEPGTDVLMTLQPFEAASEEIRTTQRADDNTEYDLAMYWALDVTPVSFDASLLSHHEEKQAKADSAGLAPEAGTAPESESTTPEREQSARAAAIKKDLESIAGALEANGGDWKSWHERLAPMRKDLARRGRENGGFLQKGKYYYGYLGALAKGADRIEKWPNHALQTLVRLNTELRERGIDLVVVPIPRKEEINAEIFSDLVPPDGITMPYKLMFFDALLKADVEVVNLSPLFRREGRSYPFLFYDCNDAHPADGAIELAARATARRLARYDFSSGAQSMRQAFTSRTIQFKMPSTRKIFPANSVYPATLVLGPGGAPVASSDFRSSVLVIGDSFIGVPTAYGVRSADFLAHLAKETGFVPTRFEVGGGAPQIMHHLARKGRTFLQGRRVCVLVFSIGYLFLNEVDTKSTWAEIDLP